MEVFQRETAEIIRRFLEQRITYATCVSALDAALAEVHPLPTGEQLASLRVLIAENYDLVTKEMSRREAFDISSPWRQGSALFS